MEGKTKINVSKSEAKEGAVKKRLVNQMAEHLMFAVLVSVVLKKVIALERKSFFYFDIIISPASVAVKTML